MVDAAQPQRPLAFNFTNVRDMVMRGEIALATVVLGILSIMLLPLPPWMLDGLLALSVTSSILVLMTALMIRPRSRACAGARAACRCANCPRAPGGASWAPAPRPRRSSR